MEPNWVYSVTPWKNKPSECQSLHRECKHKGLLVHIYNLSCQGMNLAKSRRVPVFPSACGRQGYHGEDIQDKIPPILKLEFKSGSTQWTRACTDGRDADSGVSVRTENQLPGWSTWDAGNSEAHKETCESRDSEKHPMAKYQSCPRSRQQQGRALIPGSKLVCVAGPQTVYQQAMRMTSWRQTNFYNIPVIPEGRDCLSFETLKSLPWLDR